MRIYGLVMSILFVVLFIRRIAVFTVTAWRLITKRGGITQRRASAVVRSPLEADTTAGAESPTVELPVTPAISAVMKGEIARRWRIIRVIILAGMSFFVLLGAVIDLASPSSFGFNVFPYFVLAGVAFGAFIGAVWKLSARSLRRDVAVFTYLRTSGPVQLVPLYGGYLLKLADRSFALNVKSAASALKSLRWASVDYSAHAHLILEVRDRSGRSVFSLPSGVTS